MSDTIVARLVELSNLIGTDEAEGIVAEIHREVDELERRAEQAERERDGWKKSSDEWQALWQTMKARAEQAEAERDARDTVIELQDQMLAHYRMGNTGERVGRTIDALTEARASLATTTPEPEVERAEAEYFLAASGVIGTEPVGKRANDMLRRIEGQRIDVEAEDD